MKIVSNCPLCEEHSLHILGEEEAQMMQCLSCGYVSTPKFIGKKETNEEYNNLTKEMKNWSQEFNGRIWIPTIMTLPIGMLYPNDDADGNMQWYFAEMIDILKEDQVNYPIGDTDNCYTQMYDVKNAIKYTTFFEGMLLVNTKMKDAGHAET
jgi:Zn ribbon nucleic-acid-binding protein